jgi:hypothetical protein
LAPGNILGRLGSGLAMSAGSSRVQG